MKFKAGVLGLLCLSVLNPVVADEEEVSMIQTSRISMETALMIAKASMEACREEGIQIGVTVVDREGIVQVALRDTIASQITLPISKGKAYTAAMFNAATSALGDRSNTPIGRVPGLVMSAGAIPLQVGGSLVGAVGVSGAPSGETDERCAQAGIDAVQDDLEMSL